MSQEPNNRRVRSVWNRSWVLFPLAMMLLLFFRIYYGLSMDFWNDDERQIYLMGLQWATTGAWPFFGPDVIHTHQQIAGALQPLLVGGPLLVLPLPESPILMVNLLSFGGLSLLSLYLCRLIPEAPRIIIFAWLLTLPWSLNISSHVYNPSYLLFSSCLFFVGFAEIAPGLRTGLLHQAMAFFLLAAQHRQIGGIPGGTRLPGHPVENLLPRRLQSAARIQHGHPLSARKQRLDAGYRRRSGPEHKISVVHSQPIRGQMPPEVNCGSGTPSGREVFLDETDGINSSRDKGEKAARLFGD